MVELMTGAMASGSGKTAVTCALLAALARRGLSPCAFKCGPDYIDPMFHRSVLGVESHNLDLFLCGEERLRALGEAIGHHPAFPQGCNLDLVLPQGDCLKIFTWERGAGHTLACGTGCCAAAAAGWLTGRVEASRVRLETEGGVLWVSRKGEMLLLTGPAETVCSGVFAAKWRAEQNG